MNDTFVISLMKLTNFCANYQKVIDELFRQLLFWKIIQLVLSSISATACLVKIIISTLTYILNFNLL